MKEGSPRLPLAVRYLRDKAPHPFRERKINREFEAIKDQLQGTTVGITMDGNRRAEEKFNWRTGKGHAEGARRAQEITRFLLSNGMDVFLWGFSTDNWKRDPEEIDNIFRITEATIYGSLEELHQNQVRIRHIGKKDSLPSSLMKALNQAEDLTTENKGPTLSLCLDYSGRDEITRAVKAGINSGDLTPGQPISFEDIKKHTDDGGEKFDIDFMIRTGVDDRNQPKTSAFGPRIDYAAYAFFKQTLPELTVLDIKEKLIKYTKAEKRRGGRISKK